MSFGREAVVVLAFTTAPPPTANVCMTTPKAHSASPTVALTGKVKPSANTGLTCRPAARSRASRRRQCSWSHRSRDRTTLGEIVTVLRRRRVGHLVHQPIQRRGIAWLENDVEVEPRVTRRRASSVTPGGATLAEPTVADEVEDPALAALGWGAAGRAGTPPAGLATNTADEHTRRIVETAARVGRT